VYFDLSYNSFLLDIIVNIIFYTTILLFLFIDIILQLYYDIVIIIEKRLVETYVFFTTKINKTNKIK